MSPNEVKFHSHVRRQFVHELRVMQPALQQEREKKARDEAKRRVERQAQLTKEAMQMGLTPIMAQTVVAQRV